MNVVVTGSLGFDYIMNFPGRFADRIMPDELDHISLSFLADKLSKNLGGTAGNIAYSLMLLGVKPQIIASAGYDFPEYKKFLDVHSISNKDICVVKDEPMSSYHVVTDSEGNQIGAFHIGATKYNSKLSVLKNKTDFVIISPNDPEAIKKYVLECKAKKLKFLYDPAFQIDNFLPEDLRLAIGCAAMLIGNDYEIPLIEKKLEISHEELLTMIPVLIMTIGSKGSIIETQKESIHIKPAKAKSTLDPTGAGDAYRSGFVAGFLRGYDLVTCGQMGSVAAVYTVEKYGTQTHTYTKKEFIKRYKENYGTSIVL